MRRVLRPLLAALLLPILLAAALVLAVNTEPGLRLLAWGIAQATDGQVLVSGLGGRIPFSPRLERLELRDTQGAWLRIEEASLAIDPGGLVRGELVVDSFEARSVVLTRPPEPGQDAGGTGALPFGIRVEHLGIAAFSLGTLAPGAPRLAVAASGRALGAELRARVEAGAEGRADLYRLELAIADGHHDLTVTAREAPGGLLTALAGQAGWPLPAALGAWRLDARAEGPRAAVGIRATLEAEDLDALVEGLLDLESLSSPGLRLAAALPAMALAPAAMPALAWRGLRVEADLAGPLTAPRGSGRLAADGVALGELTVDGVTAEAEHDGRQVRFGAEIRGIGAPFPLPESLATVPVEVSGAVERPGPGPGATSWSYRLTVRHPLIALAASGGGADGTLRAALTLPDLAGLAAPADLPLAGNAEFDLTGALGAAPWIQATGTLALTRAPGPLVPLLGPETGFDLAVRSEEAVWQLERARIAGDGLSFEAQGRVAGDTLALGWTLELPDISVLAAGLGARIRAAGELGGTLDAPTLQADLGLDGDQVRVTGRLRAGFGERRGSLTLAGAWKGDPVAVRLDAGHSAEEGLGLWLEDSRWASLTASGTLRLPPGATLPRGEVRLRLERLADLAALLAPAAPVAAGLDGRLEARLTLTAEETLLIRAEGRAQGLPGSVRIDAATLDALVADPLGAARTQSVLRLEGLAAGPVTGDLALTAQGPAADLALGVESALTTAVGPARLAFAGRLNAPARQLTVQRFEALAGGETLRLRAPAVLDLGAGLAVDRLRLGLGKGSVEIAGRLAPRLDLEAQVADLPLAPVAVLRPELAPAGTLRGRARLTGPPAAPVGSIEAVAEGVRLTAGAAGSLPPASIRVATTLEAGATRVDARAEFPARASLRARGRIGGTPWSPDTLALKAEGRLDLAVLDPLLTPGGRKLRGQARLGADIGGTAAAPRMQGDLEVTGGAFSDRTIGLALTDIEGRLRLTGDEARIERLTARAGPGTLTAEGSAGVLAPDLPVDLRLVGRNVRPLQSDLLEATGDLDLRLRGQATGTAGLTGSVRLSRADIRLPQRLPPTVAVLEVQERGERDHPNPLGRRSAPRLPVPSFGLDLTLAAPRAVFVRGRGVDAELGGEVRLRGTSSAPALDGGFDLLRGRYELAGQTLRFDRGRLGFDGGVGLEPTLDLEARAFAAGTTAILAVRGTLSAPRIELRGEPELPEDEVLSRLLFGVAGGRLSGVQAARLAVAAASLAGIETGGGLGLLDEARARLGLDRLSLGSDRTNEESLEGGRYLGERVYLGARQGVRAGEAQGVVRIEISPRLRLEADVGPVGGTRAGAAYEREF